MIVHLMSCLIHFFSLYDILPSTEQTMRQIQGAMELLMKGKTSFVIAHRLSTIMDSDLILVLKEGNIVEQGTHDELLKMRGFYFSLYNSQFENCA